MFDYFRGSGAPLTNSAFLQVVNELHTQQSSLWAVLSVETSGFGFLPDRRPTIRYERHVFHRRTGGKFSDKRPDISSPNSGGTTTLANEYVRLESAMALDRRAALESTSWGLGQIMGFNARKLGYADAEDMVAKFVESEDAQLVGVQRFVLANGQLAKALQEKKWDRFAFFYNGAGYAKNAYDKKMAHHDMVFTLHGMPDLDVRTMQAQLTYLGYRPGDIDGILGNATRRAILAFQHVKSLDPTAAPDEKTITALRNAATVVKTIGH
jgi:hypothetical protein